jgi:Na+/proline symporter
VRQLSREAVIGIAVSALAVGAMAVDHLVGTEDEAGGDAGLADPPAFVISVVISLALAVFLFGVVVRRATREDAERAARKAIVCGGLAVAAIALLFLGVPFPLAGAAVALGLHGREGARRRTANAAIAIGAFVLALATGAYVADLLV